MTVSSLVDCEYWLYLIKTGKKCVKMKMELEKSPQSSVNCEFCLIAELYYHLVSSQHEIIKPLTYMNRQSTLLIPPGWNAQEARMWATRIVGLWITSQCILESSNLRGLDIWPLFMNWTYTRGMGQGSSIALHLIWNHTWILGSLLWRGVESDCQYVILPGSKLKVKKEQ